MNQDNLLNQLKIEPKKRQSLAINRGHYTVFVFLLLSLVSYFYLTKQNDKNTVEVAQAKPLLLAATVNTKERVALRSSLSVLDATGYVVAKQKTVISPKVAGEVIALYVEVGQAVKKGQKLADLQSINATIALQQSNNELKIVITNHLALEIQTRQGGVKVKRLEVLQKKGLSSKAELEDAVFALNINKVRLRGLKEAIEVAKNRVALGQIYLDNHTITAPYSGVIIKRDANIGEYLYGGAFTSAAYNKGICTIVNLNSLEVEVNVSENFIGRVIVSQPVNIVLNAYSDLTLRGKVKVIEPSMDRAKAAVKVRISLLNYDSALVRPNMGARVHFLSEEVVSEANQTAQQNQQHNRKLSNGS